jgi:coenzyme F420-reducing hydrogenase alpha subunit
MHKDDEYAFIDGVIITSDGFSYPIEEYRKVTNEWCVEYSTAKWAKHNREAYMVGALARFNNNYDQLHARAKEAAAKLGLKPICYNSFLNSAAQVVEMVHCVEDSIEIIDKLLTRGVKPEKPVEVKTLSGEGVNCIIPTNQNWANVNADMQALLPQIMDKPQDEIRHLLEMLVRAYDPCISCSTHLLNVKFV